MTVEKARRKWEEHGRPPFGMTEVYLLTFSVNDPVKDASIFGQSLTRGLVKKKPLCITITFD